MRTTILKVRDTERITCWLRHRELALVGELDQAQSQALAEANHDRAEFEARHRRVLALKRQIGHNFWKMGGELKVIRDKQLYECGGYQTFEGYLASPEVSIARSTVYEWIGIVEDFSALSNVQQLDMAPIEWSKLRVIRRLVHKHPEEAAQWLAKASTLSRDELNEEVQKQTKPGNSGASKRSISQLEQCVRRLHRALSRGNIPEGFQALGEMLGVGEQLMKTLEGLNNLANDRANPKSGPIQLGWRVLLWDEANRNLLSVCIIPNGAANVKTGLISAKSPVGAALPGHRVGEQIEVETPSGPRCFRILDARPEEAGMHSE